ncbi:MAG: hypothetical protein V1853_03235 [bacterium]
MIEELKKLLIYPVHPWLFALAPILFLYSNNLDLVRPGYLLKPIIVSLVGTTLIFLIIKGLLCSTEKSALLTSLFAFFFTSFGHFLKVIPPLKLGNGEIPNYTLLGIGLIIIYLAIWIWVVRTKRRLVDSNKIVLIVGLVLAAIPLSQMLFSAFTENDSRSISQPAITVPIDDSTDKPDVYYIIFDGYARQDILSEIYGHDNSEFISFLEDKGFLIGKESTSNYPQTYFSIASSLNMEYVNYLSEQNGQESDDRRSIIDLFENNKVRQIFEAQGYQYIQSTPRVAGVDEPDQNAINFGRKLSLNEFDRMLLNTTPLTMYFYYTFQLDNYREEILSTLERLPEIADNPEPTLAYLHITLAHPPFVFDQDGLADVVPGKVTGRDGSHYFEDHPGVEDYRTRYRNQLTFLNTKIEEMIEDLLARYESPPIIVLQADHGPGSGLDWENPEQTDMHERFSILNAYFLPEPGRTTLYPKISPVNTFRIIVNILFKQELPLLEDKSYFSSWSKPYQFIDVTRLSE